MDISPDKQNIDTVFGTTIFHIDFYQRQYKWTKEPVERLLDDVFYRFNEEHDRYSQLSLIELDKRVSKYAWYYLNTYVTNSIDNRVYVVDGQQRLTTLTLILISLYHQALDQQSELVDWLRMKILGQTGFKKEFWMNHEGHKAAMQALYDRQAIETISTTSGLTAKNMVANYQIIDQWLRRELDTKVRLESFIFYFLHRLVLIRLDVVQTDVPMVFEVINDRGVRLKPYEILKGKLLGQISKEELDTLNLNELWDTQVNTINQHYDDAIDDFFFYLLRAKLANTKGEAKKFDTSEYHRVLFSDSASPIFQLQHNAVGVKDFLLGDFKYYTTLYAKLLSYWKDFSAAQPLMYYNRLTDVSWVFMLVLAACRRNDPDESVKVREVAYHVDRLFCLLQLQAAYDSNEFAAAVFPLAAEIREQPVEAIRPAFERQLVRLLGADRATPVDQSLSYAFFRDTGLNLNPRFKRYFFARVEQFIAEQTKLNMKHDFADLVTKTGAVNGFHIEHILSYNPANIRLFNDDEEVFDRERNRLGGLLLLKGKDNISSNNESFSKKLKTYANTLYWNETLREDTYKSKLDFQEMMHKHRLTFRPMQSFGPTELEERHRLLFDIAQIIWQ